jgi:predicted phosphodiesterase
VLNSLVIGLLSDTHIPYRLERLPASLLEALRGVDLILHAGDVDDPRALAPLRALAPVHAVRGNFHVLDLSDGGASLPACVELQLNDRHVVLTHGHRPGLVGLLFKSWYLAALCLDWRDRAYLNRRIARYLLSLYPAADIIVFGHTHRAYVEWIGDTLLVNPGAVWSMPGERPTMARLWLGDDPAQVEIVSL